MRHRTWSAIAALLAVGLLSTACAPGPEVMASEDTGRDVRVEPVAGTDLSRVVLSQAAVDRLGIVTAPVRQAPAPGHGAEKAVAFSAVVYDADGKSWVYVNSGPRTYVREPVTLERVDGDVAYLRDGPKAGTAVVTVGVAELFGAEYGVGGE